MIVSFVSSLGSDSNNDPAREYLDLIPDLFSDAGVSILGSSSYSSAAGCAFSLICWPLLGWNIGSTTIDNKLSIILGTICFSNSFDCSKHGFVFTSSNIVFNYSSNIKSYPNSSNVYF